MSNKYAHVTQDFTLDVSTLPNNFLGRTERERKRMKLGVAMRLELEHQGREEVIVGVTQNITFKDGTLGGQLIKGIPYKLTWDEYAALKLDGVRSFYTVLLERRRDPVRAAALMALNQMFPIGRD